MFWLKVLWVSLGGGGSFPLRMKCWFKFYTFLPGVREVLGSFLLASGINFGQFILWLMLDVS